MSSTLGERERLVRVQQLTESRGASGAPVESWSTLADVFMAMKPLRGSERFTADQLSASGDTEWSFSYRPDMDPETVDVPKTRRLQYRGRTYDITSAVPVGFKDEIELTTLSRHG